MSASAQNSDTTTQFRNWNLITERYLINWDTGILYCIFCHFSLHMRKIAAYLLLVWNLTLTSFSALLISCKMNETLATWKHFTWLLALFRHACIEMSFQSNFWHYHLNYHLNFLIGSNISPIWGRFQLMFFPQINRLSTTFLFPVYMTYWPRKLSLILPPW